MHAMHPMAAAANTPGSNLNSPMIGMVNAGLEGSVMGASLAGRGRGRGRGGGTRGKSFISVLIIKTTYEFAF